MSRPKRTIAGAAIGEARSGDTSGHDRKNHRRGMGPVVINHVRGFDHARGAGLFLAGVQVAVEAREVTARYFEAQLVSCQEDVACGPEVDRELVDFTRIHELGLLLVPRPAGANREAIVGRPFGAVFLYLVEDDGSHRLSQSH